MDWQIGWVGKGAKILFQNLFQSVRIPLFVWRWVVLFASIPWCKLYVEKNVVYVVSISTCIGNIESLDLTIKVKFVQLFSIFGC